MNIQESDIMSILYQMPFTNQRNLVEKSGHALGVVNRSLRELRKSGYLDGTCAPTSKAEVLIHNCAPQRAVILASQIDLKMIPYTADLPKPFLKIQGERLIERLIFQLHEAGIQEIYIVVGFLKEKFEYLIDAFGVQLIVNENYVDGGTLSEIKCCLPYLCNAYLIPADLWFRKNPFRKVELYSWYMVSEKNDNDSQIRCNRKMQLVRENKNKEGNSLLGLSYFLEEEVRVLCSKLKEKTRNLQGLQWEEIAFEENRMILSARIERPLNAVRIKTFSQIGELELVLSSQDANQERRLQQVLKAENVKKIKILKDGESNLSMLYACDGKEYVVRLPNERTRGLLNRRDEAEVYSVLRNCSFCDQPVYMDMETGFRITPYIQDGRSCDVNNMDQAEQCISLLREVHNKNYKVSHEFDLFQHIIMYEELWEDHHSIFSDYSLTREHVFSLKPFIEEHAAEKTLTHMDPSPDNFIFTDQGLYLIDWELSAMQDPHVDIALFCVNAQYNRTQADQIIDAYFKGKCREATRVKIYCYIAISGLMWSNWCELKRMMGTDFGGYSLQMYRYAKEYYQLAVKWIETHNDQQESER